MALEAWKRIGNFLINKTTDNILPVLITRFELTLENDIRYRVFALHEIHIWMSCGFTGLFFQHRLGSHFYPRPVFPSGIVVACVCRSVCLCFRPSVRPRVCPRDNPSLVQAFKNHQIWTRSVKYLDRDWPWPSRSNWTLKSKFIPFWACPCYNAIINSFNKPRRLHGPDCFTVFILCTLCVRLCSFTIWGQMLI